jgi:heme exporter protein B
MTAFFYLLSRDLLQAYRYRSELIQPALFFVLVVTLFPLALNSDPQLLQSIAPGIIWVAALLATLLGLEHLFRSEFVEGTLEQVILSSYPLSLWVLAKVTAHWLITGLPLIIITPLLGVMLHLPAHTIAILLLSLLLGTPTLSLLGSIGTALTLGLRQGGVLLALIILPLYIPVLIFAAGAVNHAIVGMPVHAEIALLAAMFILSLTLAPLTTAAALKVGVR